MTKMFNEIKINNDITYIEDINQTNNIMATE
jgi:hypothetical protein